MKKGKLLKNVGIFSLLPLFLRDSDAVAFWWHQAELGAITCQVNFLTRYHLQRHLIKLVGLFFPSHMTCVSNRLRFHLIDWLIESKYSCARSCSWLKFSIIKQLQKVLRLLVVKIWFEMDKIDFFYWLLIFHIYWHRSGAQVQRVRSLRYFWLTSWGKFSGFSDLQKIHTFNINRPTVYNILSDQHSGLCPCVRLYLWPRCYFELMLNMYDLPCECSMLACWYANWNYTHRIDETDLDVISSLIKQHRPGLS